MGGPAGSAGNVENNRPERNPAVRQPALAALCYSRVGYSAAGRNLDSEQFRSVPGLAGRAAAG
jgi:hypothetical protein